MSRFVRRAGESATSSLSLDDINQGFSGSYVSTTSGTFTFPDSAKTARITAIGGGGGGAYNTDPTNCMGCSAQSSGAGGGTVIAYVDVSSPQSKQINYLIGSGGTSQSPSSATVRTGTDGGTTSVLSTSFSITACGGGGGQVGCSANCHIVSSGGNGAADGVLSCIIIPGGAGIANRATGSLSSCCATNDCCAARGSLRFQGGGTYFGYGAVGSLYPNPIIPTPNNSRCATYGGGGHGGYPGLSCGDLTLRPGAPGVLYIEYN